MKQCSEHLLLVTIHWQSRALAVGSINQRRSLQKLSSERPVQSTPLFTKHFLELHWSKHSLQRGIYPTASRTTTPCHHILQSPRFSTIVVNTIRILLVVCAMYICRPTFARRASMTTMSNLGLDTYSRIFNNIDPVTTTKRAQVALPCLGRW